MAGCGESTSGEHVDNAKGFLGKNEYNSAIIELKNALKKQADDGEARYLLGKAYFETGDLPGAEKELGRALEIGGLETEVVPLYAQVLLAMGKHDLLDQLNADNLDSTARSTLLAAKAQSLWASEQKEKAISLMDQAMGESEPSPYVLVAAARFAFWDENTYEDAEGLLDKALSIDSEYGPAWSLKGDISIRNEELDAAEEAYSQALKFSRGNFADRYKRGLVRVSAGQLEEAKKDIAGLEKLAPEHPGLYFLKGLVALNSDDRESAKPAFEKAALAGSSYPLSLYYLAAIHQEEGNLATALNHANEFLVLAPGSGQGLKLVATLEYQQQNYERATSLLEPFIGANPDDVYALNLMANTLIATGKRKEGMDLLQRVTKLEPDSSQALTRLGAGLMASGEQSLGIQNLQKALELEPDNRQAELALVASYLQQGDFDAALTQAGKLRERHPESVTPYNLLGQVYLASGDIEQAKSQFEQAFKIAPGDPTAGQFLANMALRDRDMDGARQYYDAILKHHDNHLATLVNLAALNALDGEEQQMVERLQQAINVYPDAVQPRVVLGRYYLLKQQSPEAMRLINELGPEEKKFPEVMMLSAEVNLVRQNYREALANLEKLVEQQPENVQGHFLLARAYTGLQQIPDAIGALKQAIELDPNHFQARVALSRLYLISGQDEQFEEQVKVLQTLAPERTEVIQLEAALANRRGDKDDATEKLERVFLQDPSTGTVLALAKQRRASGDLDGAINQLEKWVNDNPSDVAARVALAEFLTIAKRENQAIEAYRDLLEIDQNSVPALNNLAWLLRDREPRKALEYIQRANSLKPGVASVLDTQAVLLMKDGQLEKARRSIEEALKLAPGHPTILFHSAEISAALGDKVAAKETLSALLSSDREFAEKAEAQRLLNTLN